MLGSTINHYKFPIMALREEDVFGASKTRSPRLGQNAGLLFQPWNNDVPDVSRCRGPSLVTVPRDLTIENCETPKIFGPVSRYRDEIY